MVTNTLPSGERYFVVTLGHSSRDVDSEVAGDFLTGSHEVLEEGFTVDEV